MDAIKKIEAALAAGPSEGQWVADNNDGFGAWRVWAGMAPSGHGKPGPLLFQIVGDSAETDANAAYLVATQPAYIREVLQTIASKDAEIERLRERDWIPMSSTDRPHQGQHVIVLTTDADDDPRQVFATWNGEKYGFLGYGGHRVKPVTHWRFPAELPAVLTTTTQPTE